MRKTILLAAALCLLFAGNARAQGQGSSLNTYNSQIGIVKDFANEVVTVATVSIGFTSATINPTTADAPSYASQAIRATCQNTGSGSVNLVTDGSVATNAIGLVIPAGVNFVIYGNVNITAARFIRNASTSSTIACIYSRLYQ